MCLLSENLCNNFFILHHCPDPMILNGDRRDAFPKMDLNEGFVGDGYPLCAEMPSRSFLKKGAKYRLVGNLNRPELTSEPGFWEDNSSKYI